MAIITTVNTTDTLNEGRLKINSNLSNLNSDKAETSALALKQDTLVSGTNIKTINSTSILGSGDIVITGGSGDVVGPASSTDNAIARYDGTTGKIVQNSGATLDDNGNIYINNFFGALQSTVSAGGTTVLTVASARSQTLTGSSSQTFQLPDATTLPLTAIFDFNNNSSSSLIIKNAGGTTLYTVPAGGIVNSAVIVNTTANGSWDFSAQAPASVSWSSGIAGLVMNTALSTTPSIATGASSSTVPSFIPQRSSITTGFGGDGTNLYATIAGVARATISATGITASNLSGTNTGDITLGGTPNYLTIVGQVITRALINLTSHITGILPIANGGTGSATKNFTDLTTAQTVAGIKNFTSNMGLNTSTPGYGANVNRKYFSIKGGTDCGVVQLVHGTETQANGTLLGIMEFINGAGNRSGYIASFARGLGLESDLSFNVSNAVKMTLDKDGNLGVGNASPLYKLDVSGTGNFTGNVTVPAEVYGVGWNGSNEVPTKNDVYDKIETLGGEIVGVIKSYAGSSAPAGYLICNGATLSRTTFSVLFAIIGTVYGVGDGSTTFNIPNLRGKTIVGYSAFEAEFNTVGKTGGAKTHTLTTAEMPAHNHTAPLLNAGSSAYGVNAQGVSTSNNSLTTANTGGGGAHNNLQPYMALNYIIKY